MYIWHMLLHYFISESRYILWLPTDCTFFLKHLSDPSFVYIALMSTQYRVSNHKLSSHVWNTFLSYFETSTSIGGRNIPLTQYFKVAKLLWTMARNWPRKGISVNSRWLSFLNCLLFVLTSHYRHQQF